MQDDEGRTWYGITVDEPEMMRFCSEKDLSPGTLAALFMSRAIAEVHPRSSNVIRISLCVNQRKALHAPLAHHSLVGNALLEYQEEMRSWPLEKQAAAFRRMVLAQTQEESVLVTQAAINRFTGRLLSLETDDYNIAGINTLIVKI